MNSAEDGSRVLSGFLRLRRKRTALYFPSDDRARLLSALLGRQLQYRQYGWKAAGTLCSLRLILFLYKGRHCFMALISVSHLTFCYEGSFENIFENVSFQLDTDWRLGFTGRNGRGKTTFLRLLMGEYAYSGTISSPVAFDYFPFPVADPSRSTREILEDTAPGREAWEMERELTLLEVADDVLDRPFSTLSSGEQTKVLLAGLFLREHRFLLIDEPTNHLDTHARQVLGRYLRTKSGFILVSHDRELLDACVDHILSINRTDIVVQKGNFSSWQRNKAMEDARELAENERLTRDVKRLKEAARRASDWSDKTEKSKIGSHAADRGYIGHKAAKMMKRSKAIDSRRQAAVEEKAGLLKNLETAEQLAIHPLVYPKPLLAEVRDLSITYDGRVVAEGIRFDIHSGDRIALQGRNGAGKSSLLRLLMGADVPHTGLVQVGSGLIVSYIPQDTGFLKGDLSAYARENQLDESLFKAILRKLDFSRVQFEKDMADFSGGQKKKVLLARSLCQQAHLYIWDEPLNFIDVLSRMQIEDLILRDRPTMLFVEHDAAFQRAIATRTVELG